MPAIQLDRLKLQAAQLAQKSSDPRAFVRGLHDLLEIYAEHTYKPGQAGEPQPLLTSFHVPPPVLREVKKGIADFAELNPEAVLRLCDALWAEPVLEFRQLSASLLSLISPHPPEPVLERVHAWSSPGCEERLVDVMIAESLKRIRLEQPQVYIDLINNWSSSKNLWWQYLSLKGLQPLLKDQRFENLPLIYRMITTPVREAPSLLRSELLAILRLLAQRSPKETGTFLHQNLSISGRQGGATWLARNSLRYFPDEVRYTLRQALRNLE